MVDFIKQYLKQPKWRQQHKWRSAIWHTMARLGLTGLHALPLHRRWIELANVGMSLNGLDPAFENFRIVQISDLHHSPVVWSRYLLQHIQHINELEPNLIVVTGDLITGGYRYAHRIATILSHLKAEHGVICTFGNHDYSIYGKNQSAEGRRRADYLQKCLTDRKLIVLRNQVHLIHHQQSRIPLAIVGLDDEWSGHIDPQKAFDGLDPTLPIICLNHNPGNAMELLNYPWQWMLAGHTHGRQLAVSRFGRTFYPNRRRAYTHGYYPVADRHLYVNRGLSYGQRMLDWCRPEITVFNLRIGA